MTSPSSSHEPPSVAIIGMAGRFPGAPSVESFWTLLREGREGLRALAPDELEVDPAFAARPGFVAAGGVLDGIDGFDAAFFGFTRAEAEQTDPQQRIFLMCAWEALEAAGYDPRGLAHLPVGVYAGAAMSVYGLRRLLAQGGPCLATFQSLMGCDKDYLTTRVSYELGLTGPSQTLGSACSTSLVAVALACQQLLDFTVDMALAGGVSVSAPQRLGYLHEEGGIFSSDGHCRPFDARADGTVPGNGAGVVVLKRLEDARADGDFVWAVIRGSAVNNDGDDKVGYTAPSVGGQARVISSAMAAAGVRPEDIGYVEAHGTGTVLGDPIEIEALRRAFAEGQSPRGSCPIGSVKSNVGHLNAASGVAGLIKVALALHHRELPPSLHFERPNPRIDFDRTPFFVNTSLRPWTGGPRRAGVSSFGFGGTNVHMIVEEAPAPEAAVDRRPGPHLLVVSARSEAALGEASARLAAHLEAHPGIDLSAVAATLQLGRHAFRYRRGVVCATAPDAVLALGRREPAARSAEPPPPVVFFFPGQGAQHPGMGRGLYAREPVFREVVDTCAEGLRAALGLDLRDVVFGEGEETARRLQETALAQPALFTIEAATARLLQSFGIEPAAVVGHSVGEIAAAWVAGALDLEGALTLVAARGRMMQAMAPGAMLSVWAAEAELRPLLPEGVEIAAVNGPELSVAAGRADRIEGLAADLARRGIRASRLRTSHAFHTASMEPMQAPFAALAATIPARTPAIRVLANTTGDWHPPGCPIPAAYWADQIRAPVAFDRALARLFADLPACVAVEAGPGQTLVELAASHPSRPAAAVIAPALRLSAKAGRPHDEPAAALHAAGRAFCAGVPVDFRAIQGRSSVRRVPLPTYPFELRSYRLDEPVDKPREGVVDINRFVDVLSDP
jgi:acyl transferase domain-containing protein